MNTQINEINSNELMCRICLDTDDQTDLFSPCKCSGTSKYVHRKCLMKWINTNIDNPNILRCNQCTYKYKYKPINKKLQFLNMCCLETIENNILSGFINVIFFLILGIISYQTDIYYYINNFVLNLNDWGFVGIYLSGVFTYLISITFFYLGIFLISICGYFDRSERFYNITLSKIINFHFCTILLFFLSPIFGLVSSIFIFSFTRIFIYQKFIRKYLINDKRIEEYQARYVDLESANLSQDSNSEEEEEEDSIDLIIEESINPMHSDSDNNDRLEDEEENMSLPLLEK